jgi:ABC-2 type transport system permease protein
MKTILHIIKKEFLQFKRDPKMFGLNLVAPVLQLVFLGYAATMDVNKVPTIFYDQDKTVTSRKFIELFASSEFFQVDDFVNSYIGIQNNIEKGKTIVAIIIPKDFDKKINRKETVKVQAIFNGSDGNTASIAGGYVTAITNRFSKNIITEQFEKSGRKVNPTGTVTVETRAWYNPELITRSFMVPGIVGLLLSVLTLLLTSLAVVKEKEIGTLEQLIVTPIKPYQLIIGKLVPFIISGFTSIIIVLIAMNLVFSIPVRGSIGFLLISSFLYILSTLGLGLFVSTISKTQQQAMMISVFAVLLPFNFLSGFAFALENMPQSIQYVSYLIPLRYFITIVRGVILKGNGFTEHWVDALVLLFIGVIILLLSSLRFKKRLE